MQEIVSNLYTAINFQPPDFHGIIRLNETTSLLQLEFQERMMKLFGKKPTKWPFTLPVVSPSLEPFPAEVTLEVKQTAEDFETLLHEPPLAKSDYRRLQNKDKQFYKWIGLTGGFPKVRFPFIYSSRILSHSDTLSKLGIPQDVFINWIEATKIDPNAYYEFTKRLTSILALPKIMEYANSDVLPLQYMGVGQGLPTSPYLSSLSFDELNAELPLDVFVLKYADDMIFFGPGLKKFIESGQFHTMLKKLGLTEHMDKSGWVKIDGKYVKESIKFLGLKYNFESNHLQASTRNGSTLIMNKQDLINADYDISYSTFKNHAYVEQQMQYSYTKRKNPFSAQLYHY